MVDYNVYTNGFVNYLENHTGIEAAASNCIPADWSRLMSHHCNDAI